MVEDINTPTGDVMSGRTDPATGKPLPRGVSYRGPKQYMTRKVVDGRRPTGATDFLHCGTGATLAQ